MKKNKFKGVSVGTFQFGSHCMEKESKLPSMAVVGESYTVRELVARHKMGLMSDVGMTGQFFEQENFDDQDMAKLFHLDIVDKEEFKLKHLERVKELQDQFKDIKDRKLAKAKARREQEQKMSDFLLKQIDKESKKVSTPDTRQHKVDDE